MDTFDYIVIGAGSAGCVVANRLVRNSGKTVLLIEEGGSNNNIWIQIPVGYFKTIFNSKFKQWCMIKSYNKIKLICGIDKLEEAH